MGFGRWATPGSGAGHYLPEEKPEYLNAELLRFLRMSEVVDGTEGRSRGWLHSKRYLEPQESKLYVFKHP